MSQPELRRRMRGSDAMFLYFERKEMPLHIGAVAVLDGPFDEESERLLASRLPELPRYRQRVLFPPFNLSHPFLEYDPDFDIRNHIRRVRIEPPGTEEQLSELSGAIFTELMDRSKPLWDVTVVDGLEGGRSALIIRVHHCLVDGVSGVGLMNVMFDPTREPRKVELREYNPPPLPDPGQLMVEGLSGVWADMAERLIGSQLTLLRIAQAFAGDSSAATAKALLATMPELLRPTERLPFNKPCSGVRGHCWTSFPFGEARAIRSLIGGTINDVVLTAVTGAFSRYVRAHREPVEGRFIRMMVPVNLRGEDPRGTVGNDISMLPLSVPLDIDDPVQRLRAIAQRSGAMKAARVADFVALIGTSLGWTPPYLQHSLAALPFMPQPVRIVNTVCTNVPGPMVPLYTNGRQLLTYYPHVPCGSEVGISIAISSYNQNLYYGITHDMQAAPDGDLFRDLLVESYQELRSAAGVPAIHVAQPAAAPSEAAGQAADPRAHREEVAEPVARAAAAAAGTPATTVVETSVPEANTAVGPGPSEKPEPIGEDARASAASATDGDATPARIARPATVKTDRRLRDRAAAASSSRPKRKREPGKKAAGASTQAIDAAVPPKPARIARATPADAAQQPQKAAPGAGKRRVRAKPALAAQ